MGPDSPSIDAGDDSEVTEDVEKDVEEEPDEDDWIRTYKGQGLVYL